MNPRQSAYAIWKYELPTRGKVALEMPANARPLAVQVQGDVVVLWAAVLPANLKRTRTFQILMTGEPAVHLGMYVGTFQKGWYVGHVFDLGPI